MTIPRHADPLSSPDLNARRGWLTEGGALVLLALAASIIGVANGFAYDDRYIIAGNANVHDLSNAWRLLGQSYWPKELGGDAYRPLTMLLYAVQWTIGGGSPLPFHIVNIALYAATTVAVFALASLLLPRWAAWLAAALFAVHPVHVEAVANVVGQSELIVGLVITLACYLYVRARRSGALSPRLAWSLIALYATACLAKEHGIVLPVLFVLAELLVVRDERTFRARARELWPFALGLTLVGAAYLVARTLLLSQGGAVGFRTFMVFAALHVGGVDRALTLLGIVPEWLRLLFWPARLSADYTPPYLVVAHGPALAQLPGLVLLAGVAGIAVALSRRAPVVTFGIAWAAITLAPTINFIPLAERTLYLPSVGVMIAVAGAMELLTPRVRTALLRRVVVASCAVLLVAGVARSVLRTTVWHDTERLMRTTVAEFPDSYRGHLMLGGYAFEHRRLQEGERELQRAFALFPYDASAPFWLAEQYRKVGMCRQAIAYYRAAQAIDAAVGNEGHARCLVNERQYDEAIAQIRTAMQREGDTDHLRSVLSWAQSEAAADHVKILNTVRTSSAGKPQDSVQKNGSIARVRYG